MLLPDFNICRSPRSYNSQIGVPLSVWHLQSQHQLAIFEAGISTTGEMEKLQNVIQPTIGIFTSIGAAHDEGFASREEKIREKWKLFDGCLKVICRTDDEIIRNHAQKSGLQIIGWGFHPEADYRIKSFHNKEQYTEVVLLHGNNKNNYSIPFIDDASVENALNVIVTCLELKIPAKTIATRLSELHALHMRLEWKKGIFNSLLLNDSYSHDLTSLEIALNHLKQQAGKQKMMAILSDLPGTDAQAAYRAVADLLKEKRIDQLFGIGPNMNRYQEIFIQKGIGATCFENTQTFLEHFKRSELQQKTVLVKGARAFGFERIVQELQYQQHETVLEINLSALSHNLNAYRSLLQQGTKMMVMLKAFGYGSTDAELGRWLQHHGADYLAVAYADEGVALRDGGVTVPIMVMNPEPGSFRQIIQHQLEPELYSFDILQAFDEYLTEAGLTQYPVHIKLDTGMHRLGFLPEDLEQLTGLLQQTTSLKVVTVFTHLVASENPEHDAFTLEQGAIFEKFTAALAEKLPYPFLRHAANTAGITRHPSLHYDMVRLGIGLFGVSNTLYQRLNLLPVSRLFTTVAQVKQVNAGASVGYGRHAVLSRDSRIATVRIGYADGYRRQLGNGTGFMYLNGHKAPVVGNVCMDMTMLDVTDLPDVKPGDRVEVFGEQIFVSEIARLCETIPYEIMTGISRRVKRVLVDE
jgi:alanine racemase